MAIKKPIGKGASFVRSRKTPFDSLEPATIIGGYAMRQEREYCVPIVQLGDAPIGLVNASGTPRAA